MRRGVRIGVDAGRARVGLAVCDPDGLVATPLATLPREEATEAVFTRFAAEHAPIEFVVGLPLSMRGTDTPSTADARELADRIAAWTGVPVRLVDERLSTVSAQRALRDAGRRSRGSRLIVDQVAAAIILQSALDTERSAGRPPGSVVGRDGGA